MSGRSCIVATRTAVVTASCNWEDIQRLMMDDVR